MLPVGAYLEVTCSCGKTATVRPPARSYGDNFKCDKTSWKYHEDLDKHGHILPTSRLWFCGAEGHRQASVVERTEGETT